LLVDVVVSVVSVVPCCFGVVLVVISSVVILFSLMYLSNCYFFGKLDNLLSNMTV